MVLTVPEEKEEQQDNIPHIDVNTSGHLNVFAYRLSKSSITAKIVRHRLVFSALSFAEAVLKHKTCGLRGQASKNRA
ncbi:MULTISPECIES: hypothetical protein [Pantoea]|jgi:hypothetical protein|uniref:Uncharacterized protein n=1 Tax=Pantoea sp. BJ2 TaxID=3141322 RepID=A0AAU7TV58_9GAMM|nr:MULTISPECIES: hypothetical protein [Pantoea]MBY4840930.1 hypothetical protein [Pantoea sp. DY-5]MBY4890998.1 hypothetical protein [Pantoea sp. DY-15]